MQRDVVLDQRAGSMKSKTDAVFRTTLGGVPILKRKRIMHITLPHFASGTMFDRDVITTGLAGFHILDPAFLGRNQPDVVRVDILHPHDA